MQTSKLLLYSTYLSSRSTRKVTHNPKERRFPSLRMGPWPGAIMIMLFQRDDRLLAHIQDGQYTAQD